MSDDCENRKYLGQHFVDCENSPDHDCIKYTVQPGDTWASIADCLQIPEEYLRQEHANDQAYTLAVDLVAYWGNGTIRIPYPRGARPALQYEAGRGVHLPDALPEPSLKAQPPFDPQQAVRRWLESLVKNNDQAAAAYKGSSAAPDLESLDAALRQTMGRETFKLMMYLGVFNESDSPPSVEEFLAAFGGASTGDMAMLALEVADAAEQKCANEPPQDDTLPKYAMPCHSLLKAAGYNTRGLRQMAFGYLDAVEIDSMRQEVYDWHPTIEQQLLNKLQTAIQKIPLKVLGLSTEPIRSSFGQFHAIMTDRQADLESYKQTIEAYEKAQEPTDLTWLLELGIGLLSDLNPVLKAIDLALTLRDVFVNGDMLALVGLIDFIPPSLMRGAGRFLSRIPGASMMWRFGDDVAARAKNLSRRFRRIGENKTLTYIVGRGGYLGDLVGESYSQAEAKLYQTIAKWSRQGELDSISRSTNLPEAVIQRAWQHMFVDEHTILRGDELVSGHFTPDLNFGSLWQKAQKNQLSSREYKDFAQLVAHEYIESRLMNELDLLYSRPWVQDPDYGGFIVSQAQHSFGGHELSTYSGELGFSHYTKLFGKEYLGPALQSDLSNIDDVVAYLKQFYADLEVK